MNRVASDVLVASARAGDPKALEIVVMTIFKHLLKTDYERTVAFLRKQRFRILRDNRKRRLALLRKAVT
ncbi:MAG: hypothetical protein EHM67_10115 [Hyphomicrobiaceae bacterium]|nr:MAG: hypothetical protein EHM67_10115 [Hyphomicrobiaceae bacterium]